MENRRLKNKKIENNKEKIYMSYSMLFFIISSIVFAIFIIKDKTFIWHGDGIKQHFIILYDFNQIIRNIFSEGFPMLSWNMGLGLDVIGQYSYYVIGDPFAYISLLFPIQYLESVYNLLIILRMYCVGLAFIFYCRYTNKEKINTIIGAIIYTFCGFILYAGIRHPYFTNAAILLPLNFIGIEKLLKENKKTFLIFVIFISAISNYYFFYKISIMNIIYGSIKYIFEYNQGIKEFLKKVGSFILCYAIGILMACIILLPTVYAFLNSARTEFDQVKTYIPQFYKFLFMGIIGMRFKNWTVIAISSIIILMIPILFTKLRNKEVKSYLALFLILTLMLLSPHISSMMNGFSFPSNRWIFAYSFVLAYIITITFNSKLEFSKRQKRYMLITIIVYTIIGLCITRLKIKQNLDYYACIIIAYLIYAVICYNYKNREKIKHVNYVILLLIIGNIFINALSLYSTMGRGYVEEFINNGNAEEKCATVNGKIENYEQAINYIKEIDKKFYRISKKGTTYENLSLKYDYNPIQLFLSLGNQNVYNLSKQLEDNCYTSTRCINGADRRTKISTLVANKYFICNKEDRRYIPYGYTLFHEIGDTQIYINKNYLSIGVVYNNYIAKKEFAELSPLEKEDALITTAVLEEDRESINKETNIGTKIARPVKLNYTVKDNLISNNTININKDKTIELTIDRIIPNTEIYLSIKNLKYNSNTNKKDFKVTAKLDGITNTESVLDCNSSPYYMENPDFLMNLGITKDNQNNKLKITFNKTGTYSFNDLEILAVSMEKYEEKINELKSNQMQNVEYGENYINGTIKVEQNGVLQITTSYSDGWKAYVDNKEVDVFKVNEGFIGIEVEAGKHNIRFEYTTPYLKLGIIFSVIGTLACIVIIFRAKRV